MIKDNPMFLDQLVRAYRAKDSSANPGVSIIRQGDAGLSFFDAINSPRQELSRLLQQDAKLFLINTAVVESLYELSHEATDYSMLEHLPFPAIFFELLDPLEISLDTDKTKKLKGMLFGRAQDTNFVSMFAPSQILPDQFQISLFYTSAPVNRELPDQIYFRLGSLPKFNFNTDIFAYEYAPERGVVSTREPTFAASKGYAQTYTQEHPDIVRKNFEKILNLCVNIIGYINAANVTIMREERKTKDFTKINAKRQRKGRSPMNILPPTPFYWIQVRPTEIHDVGMRVSGATTMDYQEWVRGHFQRYHTDSGVERYWLDPYVRGPEGAPWKDNRYEVDRYDQMVTMLRRGPRY